MANLLATKMEEALRPIIGTVLASVSVEVESKRIGKTPDTIDRSDLYRISENMASSLHLVVGTDVAHAAAQKIREIN